MRYLLFILFILTIPIGYSQSKELPSGSERDTTGLSKIIKKKLSSLDALSTYQLSKKKDSINKFVYTVDNWKVEVRLADSFANYFKARGLLEDATEFYDHAIRTFCAHWDDGALEYMINVSGVYRQKGMGGYALQILINALSACQSRNDLSAELWVRYNLLNLYWHYTEYELATKEWKMIDSLIVSTGINKKQLRARSWNTAGLIDRDQHDYKSALAKFDTVRNIARQIADKDLETLAEGNQGFVYFKLKEYDKALKLMLKDLESTKKAKDWEIASAIAINLAEIYISKKKPMIALSYLDSSKNWFKPTAKKDILDLEYVIAHYYAQQEDYKNAYKTMEQALAIQNAMLVSKDHLIKSINQLDLKTRQKNIDLLKAENDYIKSRITIIYALIVAITLALIASVFASVLYTKNLKARKQKEQDKLAEEFRVKAEIASAKEDVLSILSHEIRTPLNSVIGLANVLAKRNQKSDQKEIIDTLVASGDHLLHIVNDILDYHKIQAKGLTLELSPFDLPTTLKQIHSMFFRIAEDKNIVFNIKLDSVIPHQIVGDSTRLVQILCNLISNSIKFTQEGSVNLNTHLHSMNGQNLVIDFIVQDTGRGISEKEVESIFLPFWQEKNVPGHIGGTGLGLTIVKNLIELMGGEIRVTSNPGKGSTFTTRIPFSTHIDQVPIKTQEVITNSNITILNQKKILYVEDVESNRFLINSIMEDYSIHCFTAENGKQALDSIVKTSFDLILLDIQLPDMSGYEISQFIRQNEASLNLTTPIILFSAFSNIAEEQVKKCGANDFLSKPFKIENLIHKMGILIQK